MKIQGWSKKFIALFLMLTLIAGSAQAISAEETAAPAGQDDMMTEQTTENAADQDNPSALDEQIKTESESDDRTDTTGETGNDKEAVADEKIDSDEVADQKAPAEIPGETNDTEGAVLPADPSLNDGEMKDPESFDDQDAQADAAKDGLKSNAIEESEVKGEENEKTPVEITVTKDSEKRTYTVNAANFSPEDQTVTGLRACVWSGKGGKDDLTWHDMTESEGVYSYTSGIKDFTSYGTIWGEVYVKHADASETLLKGFSFTIEKTASAKVKAARNTKEASISVSISDITSEFAPYMVKAAIWRKKDKSDLKWYRLKAAENAFQVSDCFLTDFGSYSGTYHVQGYVWYAKNGPSILLGETDVTMKASTGGVRYADKYAGVKNEEQKVYRLMATGIARPEGVKSVRFLVWPAKDFSKKKYYTAKRSAAGVYYANIPIPDFDAAGKYQCHVYITDNKNKEKRAGLKDLWTVSDKLTGTLGVTNPSPKEGKFTVSYSNWNTPSGIRSIRYTVWTLKDKSDYRYYTANENKNGGFTARINIRDFNYNVGTYHVSALIKTGNGQKMTIEKKLTYNADNFSFVIRNDFGRRIIGICNPTPASDIRLAIWSDKNGQDDVHWYNAKKSGKKWTSEIVLSDFNDDGAYKVRFYSGSTFIKEGSFTVKKDENLKNGWYEEGGYKFFYVKGKKQTDVRSKFRKKTIQVAVNRQTCTINIFAKDENGKFSIPLAAFPCSVGYAWTPTPTGVYHPKFRVRWLYFKTWDTWAQYGVNIIGGKYFHSVAGEGKSVYNVPPSEYNKLGSPASHGCVRMRVGDVKYIYENMHYIEEVVIYDSANPGPFGKATAQKINYLYDPTDPAIKK